MGQGGMGQGHAPHGIQRGLDQLPDLALELAQLIHVRHAAWGGGQKGASVSWRAAIAARAKWRSGEKWHGTVQRTNSLRMPRLIFATCLLAPKLAFKLSTLNFLDLSFIIFQ